MTHVHVCLYSVWYQMWGCHWSSTTYVVIRTFLNPFLQSAVAFLEMYIHVHVHRVRLKIGRTVAALNLCREEDSSNLEDLNLIGSMLSPNPPAGWSFAAYIMRGSLPCLTSWVGPPHNCLTGKWLFSCKLQITAPSHIKLCRGIGFGDTQAIGNLNANIHVQ